MVPFLVLLPLVEQTDMTSSGAMDLLSQLGPTALVTLGSLGLLLLGGRIILRRVFEVPPTPPSPPTPLGKISSAFETTDMIYRSFAVIVLRQASHYD